MAFEFPFFILTGMWLHLQDTSLFFYLLCDFHKLGICIILYVRSVGRMTMILIIIFWHQDLGKALFQVAPTCIYSLELYTVEHQIRPLNETPEDKH